MSDKEHSIETAKAILALAPPLIRRTLLEDIDVQDEFCFASEAVLTFQQPHVQFKRAQLFDAIREYFVSYVKQEVEDVSGMPWELSSEKGKENKQQVLCLSRDGHKIILQANISLLSSDKVERIHALEVACESVNLPKVDRDAWHNVFSDTLCSDRMYDNVLQDLRETPSHFITCVRQMLSTGEIDVTALVPQSERYFERLIGKYDGSQTIMEYSSGSIREFFKQLSFKEPHRSFLFSLLLSAHSSISAEVHTAHICKDRLIELYDYIGKHGDIVSKIGAIEIGLHILSDTPEIESILLKLIRQIRDDDTEETSSQFKLLASLFVFVDGVLSETKLFSKEPPFYRRLASFSQASLIHRQVLSLRIECDSFCEFLLEKYVLQYYRQTLIDMRLEPRWDPDYGTSLQLKAELYGRIIDAATLIEKDLTPELRTLTLGEENDSIKSLCEFPFFLYPGPLEGFAKSPHHLADTMVGLIDEQISPSSANPLSFAMLVNLAPVYQLPPDVVEKVVKTLKQSNYLFSDIKDRKHLVFVLNGLASIAAMTRSKILADQLIFVIRRYRREGQYKLSMIEAIKISHLASASRSDFDEWRVFLGVILTELAFSSLENGEGKILHSHIQGICEIVPELWVSCSRADAALLAFNG